MTNGDNSGIRSVVANYRGHPATDGAGVNMNRVIATPELDHFDPFLLLDEFRSDNPNDYIAGFPDHPHRGFETVTYMLAGAMKHGDNRGNTGHLGPGSVQWMTAGRGIVHSEMPEQQDGLMWGFQLWVNLPASRKMTTPRYQEFAPEEIPQVSLEHGITLKVIAGQVGDVSGPVSDVPTEPVYIDAHLPAGKPLELPLPPDHNVFIYVYDGDASIGAESATAVGKGDIALLGPGGKLLVDTRAGARFLIIGGKPLNEPIARYGPFVMNTQTEIQQAFADFRADPARFGTP